MPLSFSRPRSLSLLVAALLLAASPHLARAQEGDEAKRHFLNGVHLFQDKNFAGALAEFEASLQSKPTAVALQNIAICQKALFRYGDAIATLERLLRDFGPTLSAEDKRAAESALHDLNGLIGSIAVTTNVPAATISINGTPLSAEASKAPVRLSAGEYTVSAEATGFDRAEQHVTVVSGDKAHAVHLTLVPASGTLIIHATDPQAAIAIDRVPMSWGDYTGTVPAGMHTVYVYKAGFAPYVSPINVVAGQSTVVNGTLGPAESGPYKGPYAPPPEYVAKPQQGLYGYATVAGYTLSAQPNGTERHSGRGAALGLRGGYRFGKAFGMELMLESETARVSDQCLKADTAACPNQVAYTIDTVRFGPSARFMTGGASSRGFATLGFGAAFHSVSDVTDNRIPADKLTTATGADGYFLIEGGWELQFGHWALGASLGVSLESAGSVKGKSDTGADTQPFAGNNSSLPQANIGLRAGYTQW